MSTYISGSMPSCEHGLVSRMEDIGAARELCLCIMRHVTGHGEADGELGVVLGELGKEIENGIDPQCVRDNAEFLLLPLFQMLPSIAKKQRMGLMLADRDKEALLTLLIVFCNTAGVIFVQNRIDIFVKLVDGCLGFVRETEREEVQQLCVLLLGRMFEPTKEVEVWQGMAAGNQDMLAGLFAQVVLSLLNLASSGANRKVQVETLQVLLQLVQNVGKENPSSIEKFLPGLSGPLVKLIVGDFKIGSRVRCAALDVWGVSVTTSLASLPVSETRTTPDDSLSGQFLSHLGSTDVMVKTSKYADDLCSRLNVLIEKIARAVPTCRSIQVDQHFVRFASRIILNEDSFQILLHREDGRLLCSLLSVLITYSVGHDTETEQLARAHMDMVISTLQATPGNPWSNQVSQLLDEKFNDLLLSLPKCASSGDESVLRHALGGCMGFARVLQERIQVAIDVSSDQIWRCIFESIMFVSEKNAPPRVQVVNEETKLVVAFPARRFEYFRENITRNQFEQMLKIFGDSEAKFALISSCFGANLGRPFSAEKLYVANHILSGEATSVQSYELCFHQSIDYLDNGLLEEEIHDPMVESLALELLSSCFSICNNQQQAKRWLVRVLFLVLKRVPSETVSVGDSAVAALQIIAHECGYKDAKDLLGKNMDYILDAMVSRLNDLATFPEAPSILQAMLCLLENEDAHGWLYPFFKDLVGAMLRALDRYSNHNDDQYVLGLLGAVKLTLRHFKPGEFKLQSDAEHRSKDAITDFLEEFDVFDNLNSPDEVPSTEVVDDDDNDEGLMADPPEEGSPQSIMVRDILSRCKYFTTHPSVFVRRLALETANAALYCFESEKLLLPAIHDIWPGVIANFRKETCEPILACAFALVETCVILSGSFMDRRFQDNVWPVISDILDTRNSHITRFEVQVLKSVFSCLCTTVKRLNSNGLWTYDKITLLATASSPYLADELLESDATDLWLALLSRNADPLWLPLTCYARDVGKLRERGLPYKLPETNLTSPRLPEGIDELAFVELYRMLGSSCTA
uniref:Uncharacterized protein n=1 Tax=Mucochytrium quahogii TaxID=96639 RepID=A0A7S2SA89_9STRA|mmetsp:Transcript_26096/g.42153  ORF Transcript_26096/g.42153 Transcript_26096/m.42153 type:complete len:1032 (-) Transcript_26096:298-3393(-)